MDERHLQQGRETRRFRWIDSASGTAVDATEAMRLDAVALKHTHHALDPALRAALEPLRPDTLVKAHVWFRVPDDNDASREELMASPKLVNDAEERMRRSMGATASRIGNEVAALAKAGMPARLDGPTGDRTPFVPVEATREALERLGDLEEVTLIMPEPGPEKLTSGVYFDVDLAAYQDSAGKDGTGVRIAMLEPGIPDVALNLPGAVPGSGSHSCAAGVTQVLCHCPAAGATATENAHVKYTTGVIRSSNHAPSGGMADDSLQIFANTAGGCLAYGNTSFASASNWARGSGARVINRSVGITIAGNPQNGTDRFLDWTAIQYPWPLVVTTAGNDGNDMRTANNVMNGLVVGGGDDHQVADRAGVTLANYQDPGDSLVKCKSQGTNHPQPQGYNGFEVPHLVAPCVKITTYGTVAAAGTSLAAPQVSGIAASLIEQNGGLSWEALFTGLMVTANEDIHGVWPMMLNDLTDDRDGAGLVNAWLPMFVLDPSAKRNGGNTAAPTGHDLGEILAASTPGGTYYSEVYNAQVQPGQRLIVASVVSNQPSCSTEQDCAQSPYPWHLLYLHEGSSQLAISATANQNYHYLSMVNTFGVTKTWTISIRLQLWKGLPRTTFGVAWLAL